MAGGNDVVRLRGLRSMQTDVDHVAQRARRLADLAVPMPAGNVGNAPFFFALVSWWMTLSSRRLHALVDEDASRHEALVVEREHTDDPFVERPAPNAADGLHRSDAGYRVRFDELLAKGALSQRFAAVVAADRWVWPGTPEMPDMPKTRNPRNPRNPRNT